MSSNKLNPGTCIFSYKRTNIPLCIAAVVVCFCSFFSGLVRAEDTHNVLIINSYHRGYFWTDDQVTGMTSILKRSNIGIQFYIEYLDTRRCSAATTFPLMKRLMATKYKDVHFDIIMSTDNDALDFIRLCRSNMFGEIPIVFSGVDLQDETVLDGLFPITGLAETMGEDFTVEAALKLQPFAEQLVIVNNKLLNPIKDLETFCDIFRSRIKVVLLEITDFTSEQFLEKIATFGRESIVLLPTRFSQSVGKEYAYETAIPIIQNSEAAIYCNNLMLIGRGVVGGCMNIAMHHGEVAGVMAVDILNGQKAEDIAIMYESPTDYIFDYNQLKRFGLSISQLPSNRHIINEPKSFYYLYKTRVWLVGSVFLVLAGMILLLSANIIKRRRVEAKLLSYHGQLKSLASELSLAEERERRRIATELHDRISQSLVISKVMLEQLRESKSSDHIAGSLDEVCNMLGQTIESSRLLTFDLSSPILHELGFEAAVADLLTEQVSKHNIATELEEDGQVKLLDDDIRGILFRMVRELLINVVKHAHARRVKVSIHRADSMIKVFVQDDGVGFEPAQIKFMDAKAGGFGLFSIRERLEQLGGRLDIESSPGRGCRVSIAAPLKLKS